MAEEKDLTTVENHHDHDHGSCGHEHHEHSHHDHDHGSCGHEHHDHHDHAHHDHEHHGHNHHDHEHIHHDHDHHHETVHISHHEGAVIGAMQGSIPIADYDEAEKHLAAQMREAGRLVTEAGGIIGHIKFIVTEAGRCGQISVTDIDESIRHFEGGNCHAEGVAIVFGVDDEKLTEILESTVGKVLGNE